ncbi:MAG TPA: ABC transporter permease [Chthoniobacterales bacterium]|jgi:putative ABC transport system permease protein|nr:ABC transporter permease [Chthoniobacterales bacterium]
MKNFLADLRFGLRMLRKSPGFALTTIAVLALGIGANAAVFSVVDAVLLRSLPLRDPERVVMLWEKNPALGGSIGERVPSAYVNFLEWQRQATQFEGIAGFEDANFNLTNGPEPERIEGARASPNIFTLLGVKPALGTTFDSAATDPLKTRVAVITDAFFRSHFGSQRSALGQTLTLNDVAYTIVGILPEDFHLPAAREGQDQHSPKLWVPYEDTATQNQAEAKRRKMQVYGRLRDGVTLDQARAEMDGIAKRLAEQDPTQNAGFGVNVFPVAVENLGQDLRRNLLVMLGAVGFVLLIACANIANLMLTRAAARQKEMAIRKALGAGGGRLISQLLAESLLLSSIGALLGLALAHYGIKALIALRPAGITRPEDIQLNLTVLLFTIGISIVAGVFFGIVPALQAARADVNAFLNQTRGAHTGSSSSRIRRALVVAEVALACVLLVGAGFMVKSMLAVLSIDPGFRADHLLTMKFSMPASRYANDAQIAAFCRQVEDKVAAMGGVKSVSFSDGLPMTRIRLTRFVLEGQPPPPRGSEPTADMRGIFSPGYFDTVGIRLIAGRNFTADELQTKAPILVMNQTLAKRLWPNESAVGQHIRNVPAKPDAPVIVSTVIGVVADTHQEGLETKTRPEITKPMVDFTQLTFAVRAAGDPESLISAVKSQVWAVDKNLPVYEVRTMEQILDEDTSQRRFQSFVMSVFAGLALVLASIGLFGVLTSLVGQRTQEIGIRMALGAQSKDVLRLVVGEGVRLVFLGVVIGVGAGIALSRYLASLFFGVSPANPATYLEVALLMIGIALIACLLPALRAIRVNPMTALRYE